MIFSTTDAIRGPLLSVVYGALVIVAPIVGAVVMTWWLGAYALVFGVSLLVLAFRLRARLQKHRHTATAQTVT